MQPSFVVSKLLDKDISHIFENKWRKLKIINLSNANKFEGKSQQLARKKAKVKPTNGTSYKKYFIGAENILFHMVGHVTDGFVVLT